MPTENTELTFYYRTGCHLCDDMWQQLLELGVRPRAVDIDRDPALQARFGTLVPVLTRGEQELCRYFLDPSVL